MGTFTLKGLSFICYILSQKLLPTIEMVLIILAFQGIPLGGSGGPEKDRMFLVFRDDFTVALL